MASRPLVVGVLPDFFANLTTDARQLCFYTGAWGMLLTLAWVGAYTAPR